MNNGHRREVWVGGREKGSSEEKDGGSCSTVVVIKTHKTEGAGCRCQFKSRNEMGHFHADQCLSERFYSTLFLQMKQFKCITVLDFDFPEHTYTNTIHTRAKNRDTYKFVIVVRDLFIIGM